MPRRLSTSHTLFALCHHFSCRPPTIVQVASSSTRATDGDRNDTCQMLDAALGEGQLSNEEHRQRVIAATNAATVGELRSLVSDLQIHSAPVQLGTLK